MTEKVVITNILGQNLRSVNNKNSSMLTISTEGLHKGIYLVNIYTVNGEITVKRMVKYK